VTRALYTRPEVAGAPPEDPRTGLAAGWLAMLPLLCACEWGRAATGGARRNFGASATESILLHGCGDLRDG
jgi:hypothetical protein